MRKLFPILALFILGISCQNNNIAELDRIVLSERAKVRTPNEVEQIVSTIFKKQAFEKRADNSKEARGDELKIEALTSRKILNAESSNDTLLYLVNDRGQDNSIIVSANSLYEPIIAILDKGNISKENLFLDTGYTENPFMPLLLSAIEYNKDPEAFNRIESDINKSLSLANRPI